MLMIPYKKMVLSIFNASRIVFIVALIVGAILGIALVIWMLVTPEQKQEVVREGLGEWLYRMKNKFAPKIRKLYHALARILHSSPVTGSICYVFQRITGFGKTQKHFPETSYEVIFRKFRICGSNLAGIGEDVLHETSNPTEAGDIMQQQFELLTQGLSLSNRTFELTRIAGDCDNIRYECIVSPKQH